MRHYGLDGKIIKDVRYDSEYKESVAITFTDGTVAMIWPLISNRGWPTMTISYLKETE